MPDKVALITGISSPVGLATAGVLARNGYIILGMDRDEPSTRDNIHHFVNVNLAKPAELQQAFTNLMARMETHGRLDLLVNKAEHQLHKSLIDTKLEDMQYLLAVNVQAPMLLAKISQPLLSKYNGSIINVGSVQAVATNPNCALYSATKGAMMSLTRGLSTELSGQVRVNAIIPTGQPTDVANAIHFLSGDTKLNGQTLAIDKGSLAQIQGF